jgi:hypothetical protein
MTQLREVVAKIFGFTVEDQLNRTPAKFEWKWKSKKPTIRVMADSTSKQDINIDEQSLSRVRSTLKVQL